MRLDGLNPAQKEAVLTTDGAVLVVAGAGSGKTRVLTHRIANLIENHDVFPSNILAITFTNKAANEMKNRIEALVGSGVAAMWVGTFHAICVRILRRHGDYIGYSRDFVIYDTTDQKSLIKSCFKALNLDEKQTPIQSFQYKISNCKNDMLTPEAYEAIHLKDPRERDFIKLYKMYQDRLKANQALDFDDLLIKTVELLKNHPDVLAEYQNRFKYIHVDEYQDTNKAQYTFIRLISAKSRNIFVVGDGDQSIYKWRGADIRNILEFEKDFPGAQIIKLEQNYRSTQNILSLANGVIKNNPGRRDKNLWTESDEGEKIKYYQAYDEKDEANFVIKQMLRLMREGTHKASDFAILYRTNAQSRVFEERLVSENINYKIVGGHKFYERKEIKDVMAYLKLLVNKFDDVSFLRVINEPKRSIGDKTIEKLSGFANERGLSLFEACGHVREVEGIGGKTAEAIHDFYRLLDGLRKKVDTDFASNIFEELIVGTEIIECYRKERTDEADGRIDNIYELKAVIEEFEKRQENSGLRDFLAEVTLKSDQDSISEEEEGVLLMTLHASKGLEFPVVFLVGLEDSLFPSFRAQDDDEELEEERRLCYVGITRAEKLLYITHANNRNHFGKYEKRRPSQFLREMDQKLIEACGEKKLNAILNETKPKEHSFFDIQTPKKNAYTNARITNPYLPQETQASATEAAKSETDLSAGDKVMHKVFGSGLVIAIDKASKIVTIVFDAHGIKKLDPSIAPLKIIG